MKSLIFVSLLFALPSFAGSEDPNLTVTDGARAQAVGTDECISCSHSPSIRLAAATDTHDPLNFHSNTTTPKQPTAAPAKTAVQ